MQAHILAVNDVLQRQTIVASLGAELVQDSAFSTDFTGPYWENPDGTWSIDTVAGTAHHEQGDFDIDYPNSGGSIQQDIGIEDGKEYLVTFTVDSISFVNSGHRYVHIKFVVGGVSQITGGTINKVGTYTTIIPSAPADTWVGIFVECGINTTVTISNIHVREAYPVVLTQANILAVNDINQAQALDNVTLSQGYILAVAGLLQSQTIDNITLQLSALAPQDISQAQSIDAVSLTEYAVLSVNDLTQSQVIDIVNLGGLIIGELAGTIVIYAKMGGDIVVFESLSGSPAIYESLSGTVATRH